MQVFLEKIPVNPVVEHWALRVGNGGRGGLVYEYENSAAGGCVCSWAHRSNFGSPSQTLHMGATTRSHEEIQDFCAKYTVDHPEYNVLTCNCQHFIQALHAWLGCQEKLPVDQVSDIVNGLRFIQSLVTSFHDVHPRSRPTRMPLVAGKC